MRGGRVLGPIERLIVTAVVVSGGTAGAGFASEEKAPKVDEITEYFLIGTFVSVLIAGVLALLVLAAA
jgi:hypothetical protein